MSELIRCLIIALLVVVAFVVLSTLKTLTVMFLDAVGLGQWVPLLAFVTMVCLLWALIWDYRNSPRRKGGMK
jgi:hypothetical protein